MSTHLVTVGNPNSGKTTLFNALTGANQKVGNWSGVTVDKKEGAFTAKGASGSKSKKTYRLLDLPGIYSLDDQNEMGSVDEQIAFNYIMDHQPDLLINVVDASTLERGLYLSMQLRELGLPLLVVINKIDSKSARHLQIDTQALSLSIGAPVIAISALDKQDVNRLVDNLPEYIAQAKQQQPYLLQLPETISAACQQLTSQFETQSEPSINLQSISATALALRLLEGDSQIERRVSAELINNAKHLNAELELDLDLEVADSRYSEVYKIVQAGVKQTKQQSSRFTAQVDNLLLNRYLGVPIFLGVLYLLFMFTINFGSAFIDFFDIIAGALFVDGSRILLESFNTPAIIITIISDGIGAGLQTVATFIPIIATLFLGLSLLERSGYMARAAFVVDSLMQKIGLPGKAFVPMVIGFGCSVPAIMATRTLEQSRERIVTSLMSPFISCGARLPVYVLFAAAFFPESGQNIVFLLYLIGILAAVGTGLLLKSTLLPGNSGHFVMELPDYELPTVSSIFITTWHKLKGFILGAGKTIVLVVAMLNLANSISPSGELHAPGDGDSILSETAKLITPMLSPLGIKEDNWPATVGIITGIFAKEAVVGTLNSLYSNADADSVPFDLSQRFSEAFTSVTDNLKAISFQDPMGIGVGELTDLSLAAQEQEVEITTFDTIRKMFDGQAGAFSYLLFILLYMPCAAAMGALVRELGRNWAIFAAAWSTGLALAVSTIFYQLATFSRSPLQASSWLLTWLVIALVFWFVLQKKGKRAENTDVV